MELGSKVKLSEVGRNAHHERLHSAQGEVVHISGETVSVRWQNVMRRSGARYKKHAKADGPATTTGHILHFEYFQEPS